MFTIFIQSAKTPVDWKYKLSPYSLVAMPRSICLAEEECKFEFTAEKFFREPVMHQIYEGVCINRSASTPGYLMNSRAEYEQGQVARLVVAQGL